MKLKLPGQIFKKYTKIIIYKNPSSGSRVVPGGRADGRTGQTDMQKERQA